MDLCAQALAQRRLPFQLRQGSSNRLDLARDGVKVRTLRASRGWEFPVVALVGGGPMPAEGADEREAVRLFYLGATRATQRLVIGAGGKGRFTARLSI